MTAECLESIISKTKGVQYEIILVDNASKDGSKEFFSNYRGIKYIYSDKNLGFGKANNLGFKYSSGKYVFCLNSDTLFLNNALKYFFDYAEKDSDEAIYGCNLLDKDGKEISWNIDKFPTVPRCLKNEIIWSLRLQNIKKKEVKVPPYYVDYIVGAAMFIPAIYIKKYGGFDERYFMYCEESDMQLKFARYDIKRLIIPGPQIIHFEGKSANQSMFSKLTSSKSHYIYFKKNASAVEYYYYRVAHFILNVIKIPFKLSSFREKILLLKILVLKVNLNEMAEERDS